MAFPKKMGPSGDPKTLAGSPTPKNVQLVGGIMGQFASFLGGKAMEITAKTEVSTKEIAQILGVTTRWVQQLTRKRQTSRTF